MSSRRQCTNKACAKCGRTYEVEWFHGNQCTACMNALKSAWYQRNKESVKQRTTEWNRNNRRKRHSYWIRGVHGITLDQYEEKLRAQGNACAICGEQETVRHKNGLVRRMPIDHDHATGKIRDLLCYRCNSMIGYSRERIDLLFAAINYLIKHKPDAVAEVA